MAFVEIADQKALNNTFHGCANLSSVDLAATDAEQLVGTFMNCTGLKQVRMPLSLRTIDKYAFSGCKQLSNIVFDSNIGEVNVNSLDGIATQLTAENTNSTSGYKYQLGRDYVLGIRLSGDSYSNKNDVASEISAAVNALINTKPTKFSSSTRTSRRFKLYLNDGNPLKLDNAEQVYNPLVDVSGPLTADISFREFRIVDENTNPQC